MNSHLAFIVTSKTFDLNWSLFVKYLPSADSQIKLLLSLCNEQCVNWGYGIHLHTPDNGFVCCHLNSEPGWLQSSLNCFDAQWGGEWHLKKTIHWQRFVCVCVCMHAQVNICFFIYYIKLQCKTVNIFLVYIKQFLWGVLSVLCVC